MKRKNSIAIPMLILAIVVAISALQTASTAQDATTVPQTITLAVGEHSFWDEGDEAYVDTTTNPKLGKESYDTTLVTQSGGGRLRVALDLLPDYRRNKDGTISTVDEGVHPDTSSGRTFTVQILKVDKNGLEQPVLEGNTGADTLYSLELFVCFDRDLNGNGVIDDIKTDQGWSEACNPVTNGIAASERLATSRTEDGQPLTAGGLWKVRVTPQQPSETNAGVTGWKFRMRAKLEEKSNAQTDLNEALYPNLRALPPFELTFCEPQVSYGFFVGTGAICGQSSNGLTDLEEADLIAEQATEGIKTFRRGLRFSSGPENVGAGHFELQGAPSGEVDPETGNPLANVEQHVYTRGGSRQVFDDAGLMDFHVSHSHWHYQFFLYELFRVTRSHPTKPWKKIKLGERVVGSKSGFCPSDEILGDWARFYQSPGVRQMLDRCGEDGTTEPVPNPEGLFTCLHLGCVSPTRPLMGMSSGWGDYYEWQRIEQFVEFPVNLDGSPQDGYYLLRSTVDRDHKIRESNEDDNEGYVLFEVKDGRITIHDSGYGPEP